MKVFYNFIKEIRNFGVLWLTQAFSSLGSSMTNFALILWTYEERGSALTTALLSVCIYAPYVVMSIFAGAISDRWSKKTVMLVCDSFAAACTVGVWFLFITGRLKIWHLYGLNALNGLMNTIQQPASDVTITMVTPKKYYQLASGMRSFSNSLVSILTPVLAAAMYSLMGLHAVILFDLFTFFTAFLSLLFIIEIPEIPEKAKKAETILQSVGEVLKYLKENRGILDMILCMACINLIASTYEAALPPMLLSRAQGGKLALGLVNGTVGIATLCGSVIASMCPAPKSRVRVFFSALFLSMSTENFFLAFGRTVPVWCMGAALGWIAIPIMQANMDVLMRNHIPVIMQGRVYSARNTLQFFTIPVGYFLGGWLVDYVFEPFIAAQRPQSLFLFLFGEGKGSGAALLFFVIAIPGILVCLIFSRDRNIWNLEQR